jgi:hypothetical protein
MSEKIPGKLVFACGGTIEANDVSGHKIGERLIVGTQPHQNHQMPKMDGKDHHCVWSCPSTIKLSGRKFYRSGWFEDGTKGMMMSCKITGIVHANTTEQARCKASPGSAGCASGSEAT